eukprot:1415516-Pleurochrysis_carterae.AAC.1
MQEGVAILIRLHDFVHHAHAAMEALDAAQALRLREETAPNAAVATAVLHDQVADASGRSARNSFCGDLISQGYGAFSACGSIGSKSENAPNQDKTV